MKILVAKKEITHEIYHKPPINAVELSSDSFHFANIDLKEGESVKVRTGDDRIGYLLITLSKGKLILFPCVYEIEPEG